MKNILVVDDDPLMVKLISRILSRKGYRVLESSNGQDALRMASEFDDHIDLLVTDVIMPHMNGKDLADQILAVRPHTKTLFTSGYTDDAIVQHGVLKPGIAFLPKPFSPAALGRKVRETLDVPSER